MNDKFSVTIDRKEYEELKLRLYEAEQALLKQKQSMNELLESIRTLNPKKVTMEF